MPQISLKNIAAKKRKKAQKIFRQDLQDYNRFFGVDGLGDLGLRIFDF
jgi:hypothetical protein